MNIPNKGFGLVVPMCLILAACGSAAPVTPAGAPAGGSAAASPPPASVAASKPAAAPAEGSAAAKPATSASGAAAPVGSGGAAAPAAAGSPAAAAGTTCGSDSQAPPTADEERMGVSDNEIVLGTWNPQTGPAAPGYSAIARAANAYLQLVNSQGGINGRKVRYVIGDDQYQPSLTLGVAKKLVEQEKVFAAMETLGTPGNLAAMPYMIEHHVPVAMVQSGSKCWSSPANLYYFGWIPNYSMEDRIAAKYTVDNIKPKKVGTFYQNDAFGKEDSDTYVADLKKAGIEVVAQVPYEASDSDFSSAALKLQAANPDLVWLAAIPKPGALLMKESEKIGFRPKFYGSYVLHDTTIFELAGKTAVEGAYFGSYTPDPNGDSVGLKQFRDVLKQYSPQDRASSFALTGYWGAQIMVDALKRAGKDLTRSGFIKAMEATKDYTGDIGGPPITFSHTDRVGVKTMMIDQAKNGDFVKVSDYVTAPGT